MKKFAIFAQDLKKVINRNPDYEEWARLLTESLSANDITDHDEVLAFIAQCAHESNQFRALEENLNYSKTALKRVFKKYFSADEYEEFARNPERIANRVYANRLGNGPESSGDGWKFRGHGVIQLTGRSNITKFGKSVGKSPDETLAFLETKEGALAGAVWFWKENKLSRYVDNFESLTRKINGGLNGYDDRLSYLKKAQDAFPSTFWMEIEEPEDPKDVMVSRIIKDEETKTYRVTIFDAKPKIRLFHKGENVSIFKRILRFLGFDIDTDNDLYDKKTFNAVRDIQKKDNKLMTGIMDENTWSTVKRLFENAGGDPNEYSSGKEK